MNLLYENDTIVAISTPAGVGGIAVIRVSGKDAREVLSRCWNGIELGGLVTHTAHLGKILMNDGSELDEVVITFFKGPHSFTGEDVIEISCHGSKWIQREIVNALVCNGARPAEPGEFTKRAFLNGRIDLAQAEGVIDMISTTSKAAHKMAMQQMDGKFSSYFNNLREQLIELASLLELELDFSEEEVEFADRDRLLTLCESLEKRIVGLAATYSSGKAIKEGIRVVIAGIPNAGKSTLLNQLLGEDKAIVTDIPGTTRDVIEDTREIGGMLFRFVDTAGLRSTDDMVEQIGIQRAEERMSKAAIILWVVDITADISSQMKMINSGMHKYPEAYHIRVINKCDEAENNNAEGIHISAKDAECVEKVEKMLVEVSKKIYGVSEDIIISNARHYAALTRGVESLARVREGLANNLSADFVAQDLREAIYHLSSITGSITTPDLLSSIFSRFCVGK